MTASRARYLNGCWNRFDVGSKRLRRYRDNVITLYDAGVCWMDAQISRLLVEVLRQLQLWRNCVFALTADHGEEFLEHGRYHAPALTEELIHVPLVLRVPGAAKREVSSNPFSLLHLAPTLLAAAGLPIPVEFQGQVNGKKFKKERRGVSRQFPVHRWLHESFWSRSAPRDTAVCYPRSAIQDGVEFCYWY